MCLIYNNYHNPTSANSSQQEVEELAELALRHDLWVLTDDAYYENRYTSEPPISIVNLPGMQERSVILYTYSKRFAMTGWRCGAAIGPQSVIDMINRMNTNVESCTAQPIQYAALAGVTGSEDGPAAILRELRARRDAAVEGLNEIEDISITAPESTFYLFPNVTKVMQRKGIDDVNMLMDEALVKADVSFCTRKHFGRVLPGETQQYIRLAYSGLEVPHPGRAETAEGVFRGLSWLHTGPEASAPGRR